jgi:hypothetical protein
MKHILLICICHVECKYEISPVIIPPVDHSSWRIVARTAGSWTTLALGLSQRLKLQISYVILFDLQLDVQILVYLHIIHLLKSPTYYTNSCLFTYNTFIKIPYIFRPLPCLSSGGLRLNCIYAASSIVTLHIYNYNVGLLKMSRVMLETCRGF